MRFFEKGDEACDFLASNPVDVVCSDLRMPKMNGSQLLSHARRTNPETIRIVLSGQADDQSIFQLVSPSHVCLSKPCNQSELTETITNALHLKDFIAESPELNHELPAWDSMPELEATLQFVNQNESNSDDLRTEIEKNELLFELFMEASTRNIFDVEELKVTLSPQRQKRFVLAALTFLLMNRSANDHSRVANLLKRGLIASDIVSRIANQELDNPEAIDIAETAGLLLEFGHVFQLDSQSTDPRDNDKLLGNKLAARALLRLGFPLGVAQAVAHQNESSECASSLSIIQIVQFASRFLNQNDGFSNQANSIADREPRTIGAQVVEQWQLARTANS